MQQFTYVIRQNYPMYFGAAGHMADLCGYYPDTKAIIEMGNRIASVSRAMKVMAMGIRKGDKVTVTVEGPSEVELTDVLYHYFEDTM